MNLQSETQTQTNHERENQILNHCVTDYIEALCGLNSPIEEKQKKVSRWNLLSKIKRLLIKPRQHVDTEKTEDDFSIRSDTDPLSPMYKPNSQIEIRGFNSDWTVYEEIFQYIKKHSSSITLLKELFQKDKDNLQEDEKKLLQKIILHVSIIHYAEQATLFDLQSMIDRSFLPDFAIHTIESEQEFAHSILNNARNIKPNDLQNVDVTDQIITLSQLFGGEINEDEKTELEYDIILRMESQPWWTEIQKTIQEEDPQFIRDWIETKQVTLDHEAKMSFGRLGKKGYLFDLLESDELVKKRGEKELLQVKRKLKRFIGKRKLKKHNDDLLAILDNNNLPLSVQIQKTCELLSIKNIRLQKSIKKANERLDAVSQLRDREIDTKNLSKVLNFFRLLYLLSPYLNKIPHTFWQDVSKSFMQMSIQASINMLASIPAEILTESLNDFEKFTESPSPETAIQFLSQMLSSSYQQESSIEKKLILEKYYSPEVADRLLSLESIVNPDQKSMSSIISDAINLYHQNYQNYPDVFWRRDPEYTSLQDFTDLTLDTSNSIEFVETNFSQRTFVLYQLSSDNFYLAYEDAAYQYSTLNPESQINVDIMKLYLSDYFTYIFSHSNQEHQLSGEELLSFALAKNMGDLGAAFWDVSLVLKIFTRYNIFSGEITEGAYSGILAIELLNDQFSSGYTAHDLSEILPFQEYSQYWDLYSNGSGGVKNADPANPIGNIYHIWNTYAFTTLFPIELLQLGIIKEYMDKSGHEDEYGTRKMEEQFQYVSNNLAPVQTMLDTLSAVNEYEWLDRQPSMEIVFLDPLMGGNNEITSNFFDAILAGNIVSFVTKDGQVQYATIKGSIAHPYILLCNTVEQASNPISLTTLQNANILSNFEYPDNFNIIDHTISSLQLDQIPESVRPFIQADYILSTIDYDTFDETKDHIAPEILNILLTDDNFLYQFSKSPFRYTTHIERSTLNILIQQKYGNTIIDNFSEWHSLLDISKTDILDSLMENSIDWGDVVSSNPYFFSDIAEYLNLESIVQNDGLFGILDAYFDWKDILDIDDSNFYNLVRNLYPDRWQIFVLSNPTIFKDVVIVEDFQFLTNLSEDDYALFHTFLDNYHFWNQKFSIAAPEIKLIIDQTFTNNTDKYDLLAGFNHLPIFADVLSISDIQGIVESGHAQEIIDILDLLLSKVITKSQLFQIMKAQDPYLLQDIFYNGVFFAEVARPEDITIFYSSEGIEYLNEYFSLWQTPLELTSEQLYILSRQYIEYWGATVARHPEIYLESLSSADLNDILLFGGVSNIISYFSDWEDQLELTPDKITEFINHNEIYLSTELLALLENYRNE